MRSIIQATLAYELSADITPTAYGYDLKFISSIPSARRPEEQVKFKCLLSTEELKALGASIELALQTALPSAAPFDAKEAANHV